ncbi:MAG: hypothetical protein PHQ33_05805 [Bacteroidales bacterium]|nr:hypothetical protein [Bacteroidales bacterium]
MACVAIAVALQLEGVAQYVEMCLTARMAQPIDDLLYIVGGEVAIS